MTTGRKILTIALLLLPVLLAATVSILQLQRATTIAFPLLINPRYVFVFYAAMILTVGGFTFFFIRRIERCTQHEATLNAYEGLLENTQIMMRNMDNEIISWNQGMENLYGWNKVEVLGKTTHQLFSTVFPEPLSKIEEILFATNQWQGELKHTKKDGSTIIVSSHWSLNRNKNGIAFAITESNNDITALKKSEERVAVLSRHIDQSNDSIFAVDKNRLITSWNRGAEKIYGFSVKEAIGREVNELLQTTMDKNEINRAVSYLSETDYWTGELTRKRKDGSEVHVYSSSSTVRESDGSISGYVGVSLDITEQVQLKNQVSYLAGLVDQSSDAIVSISLKDRTILSWNKGAERLHGYNSKEVIGKKAKDLGIFNPSEQEIIAAFKQVKEKGYWQSEMSFSHKNGSRFVGAINVNPVKDHEGKITGLVFIVRDITLRKNLEETLRKYNAELENKMAERTAAAHKNEQRFRAMVENNNDIVSMMDASMNVFYRSPSFVRVTGWTPDEIKSKENPKIHPEDITTITAAMQLAIASPRQLTKVAFRTLHKDGHYLSVEGSIVNLLDDENVQSIVTNFRDVTEKIAAEKKLTDSEKRFRTIIENNYDSIVLMDQSFKTIYRSPASSRLTGWTDEEMERPEAAKNIHPDDSEKLKAAILEAVAQPDKPVNILYRFRHKKGYYVWVEANIINRLADESMKALVFNSRDVTQRIHAEEKLAYSERHFRALIENNYDVISLMDASFRVFYRSPSAARITGWTDEEMLNDDGKKNIHPDDRESAATVIQEIMANPGKPVNTVFRNLHKNGHYIWVEGIVINRLQDENVRAIVFNYRDITERKETEEKLASSEKRFRTLIENNYDVITLMDESFKLIYRSPAATRVTGWTNEDMLTIDATLHIHPDDRPAQLNLVKEVMASPGKRFELLFRMIHKQGYTIWVEGVMTNWLEDENVRAIVFNYRDVTERKDAEEKLISSEQRFRLLIENSAEGVSLLDQSSNVTYRSPAGYKILGNRDVKNAIAFAHPDFLADFKNKFSESLAKPGIAVPYESRYARASGEYFWTEGSFTNLLDVKGINGVVANYRDVTKRKELEDLLNKAYALARTGGWEINIEKGIVYWSDITREIHETEPGYVPDLATGLRFYKEGATRDLITTKVKEAIKLGTAWDVELQIVTAKNNTRWIRSIGHSEFVDGKCIRIYGSFQDINERREAQEQLKASEARFRSLIENISDGIVLTDKDSYIRYQSPSVTKIIGYELADRKGKNLLDFVHPDSRQDLLAFNERLGKTKDIAMPFQYRFRHKDGRYIWLEGFVRNLLHDPGVNAFVSNYRDITERKEAEEALQKSEKLFRSLFENMHNGFAYYKAVFKKEKLVDAVYIAANAGYELLVGVTHLPGRNVTEVLPGLLHPDGPYTAIIERVLQTGKPEKFETFMQPLKKWLSVAMYSPVKGYFVVLTDDITERKMVEQKIKNINAELEARVIKRTEELKKVNEELEAFSYSVSHDLRAPLRGIIGFTAILEEEYSSRLDAEAKRLTAVIKNNTLKMGNLIDDLLMFSRMGRQHIEKSVINSNEMLRQVIEDLGKNNDKPDINWAIDPLHTVRGDAAAIRQVWFNLIANAIKYSGTMPQQRIEIQSKEKEGKIIFSVKDNGVGFDQKYSGKLFKVFQRLHGADEFEGTGVGLAIVEKIISKHGGKVWAEGMVDKGATFYFSLPVE